MLTIIESGAVTMSSREIAEFVEASHDSVLKTIRDYKNRGVVSGNETLYQHLQNKQFYPEFHLNKRDSLVIASGYSVILRARIIDRWQELEAAQTAPAFAIPQTLSEALRLAADQADVIEAQTLRLTVAEPKAAALDVVASQSGELSLTEAAKYLNIAPRKFMQLLQQLGWIYRFGASSWVAYQPRITSGYLHHRAVTIHRTNGENDYTRQVLVTPKGLARLAVIFSESVC